MLYMHTVTGVGAPPASDLTARAQIRHAAIECFAQSGFRASFRDISTRAGVSPALITHHFGSKAALREECDLEVLRRYHTMKTDAIPQVGNAFAALVGDVTHDQAVVTVYILRVLEAGGSAAEDFLAHLGDQVGAVLRAYEDAGLVRPSSDEGARARFLARTMIGSVLVAFLTTEGETPEDFVATLLAPSGDFTMPLLELCTEGLLTSTSMLDQYRAAQQGSSEASTPSTSDLRTDGE